MNYLVNYTKKFNDFIEAITNTRVIGRKWYFKKEKLYVTLS